MDNEQLQAALTRLLHKAVARVGHKHVWQLAPLLLQELQPQPPCAAAVRAALRTRDVYMPDDDYVLLATAFSVQPANKNSNSNSSSNNCNNADEVGERAMDVQSLLRALAQCALSPRRRFVVDLVVRKLDAEQRGVVSNTTLYAHYDALRHPDVVSHTRRATAVVARFFADLQLRLPDKTTMAAMAAYDDNNNKDDDDNSNKDDDGNSDDGRPCALRTSLPTDELRLYLAGVSMGMTLASSSRGDNSSSADDTAFELMCARAFCLDRPRLSFDDEARRLQGSQAMYHATRLIHSTRAHPLYETTSATYGVGCCEDGNNNNNNNGTTTRVLQRPAFGRVQRFTRSLPTRLGGATTMNM